MRILGETGLLPMAEYGIDSPGRDHLGDRTRWVVNRGNGDPTGCDCLGDGTRVVMFYLACLCGCEIGVHGKPWPRGSSSRDGLTWTVMCSSSGTAYPANLGKL
ncbi:unnamed protein product [Microthlaspi erraticum]|uniref:Uncharacterized protein n=1 Tax=Microthlaspi erraticum TaxID=1685480 RepID=A0A6D2KBU6_9BRAS|nr:unnamed protein product [Microthlaspi erraticum]